MRFKSSVPRVGGRQTLRLIVRGLGRSILGLSVNSHRTISRVFRQITNALPPQLPSPWVSEKHVTSWGNPTGFFHESRGVERLCLLNSTPPLLARRSKYHRAWGTPRVWHQREVLPCVSAFKSQAPRAVLLPCHGWAYFEHEILYKRRGLIVGLTYLRVACRQQQPWYLSYLRYHNFSRDGELGPNPGYDI